MNDPPCAGSFLESDFHVDAQMQGRLPHFKFILFLFVVLITLPGYRAVYAEDLNFEGSVSECNKKLSLTSDEIETLRFDRQRAVSQIELHGYYLEGDISLKSDGHWCGMAMKFGDSYAVRIDRYGNFFRERLLTMDDIE